MNEQEEKFLEVEENEFYPQTGNGVMAAGIYGDADYSAMADRAKRVASFQSRYSFRDCVSCDRCYHCIEIRRFTQKGETETLAYYCLYGEFETGPYKTCNCGHATKTGRRKVVYDMTNAPVGFGTEQGDIPKKRVKAGQVDSEGTGTPDVYRGGSVGVSETMPRRLMN